MPVRENVKSGLDAVSKLTPGRGYAEATVGVAGRYVGPASPFARLEVGWKLAPSLSGFGYGQAETSGYQAGVGLRWTW